MKYFPKIKGKNLYLSPINPDDYELYTKWINDLTTSIPLGGATMTYSLMKEKELLEKISKEENMFAIVDKASNEAIGNCSLFNLNQIHGTAELGIFLGAAESRGRGYGSEAIELLLNYGFKMLNLHNIKLGVFSFNERGIACYEKCGFKEYGRRREAFKINGRYFDEVHMDILEQDFAPDFVIEELPR